MRQAKVFLAWEESHPGSAGSRKNQQCIKYAVYQQFKTQTLSIRPSKTGNMPIVPPRQDYQNIHYLCLLEKVPGLILDDTRSCC